MTMRNKPFLIGIVLSPLVYVFVWFLFNKPQPEMIQISETKPVATFDLIPTNPRIPITKKTITEISEDGSKKEVTITDFAGKPTVLHFWATWCAPCVEEMPEIDEYAKKYGDKINLIVIANDKSGGTDALKFYKEKGFKNLKVYVDDRGEFMGAVKIKALPTTIFVTSDSLEIGRVLGPIEWLGGSGEFIMTSLTQ